MHDFSASLNSGSTKQLLASDSGLLMSIGATDTLTYTGFASPDSGQSLAVSLTGRTDVIVKLCRDQSNSVLALRQTRLELWNSDGTGYTGGLVYANPAGAQNLFSGGGNFNIGWNGAGNWFSGRIAWFRMYSASTSGFATSILPPRALPPSNIVGGDMLDLEFEGNTVDSSSHSLSNSSAGTPTYNSTAGVTQIPGPCNGAYDCSVRAGAATVWDGTNNASGTTTYSWTQLAYPSGFPVDFGGGTTSSTSGTPTILMPVFGQYTLKLCTVVSSVSSCLQFDVGAVATNSSGVVVVSNSDPDIGARMAWIIGAQLRHGLGQWTAHDYNAQVFNDFWLGDPGNQRGNAACIAINGNCNWDINSATNYYDSVMVGYVMYFRTGLTKYRTRARAEGLWWWVNSAWNSGSPVGGCGSNFLAPRDGGAGGLILLALDTGAASYFTCIQAWASYEFDLYIKTPGDATPVYIYIGIREPGYAWLYATELAVSHPDSSTRSAWVSRLDTYFTKFVVGNQCTSASTSRNCTKTTGVITGTVTVTVGSPNVVGSGTTFLSQYAPGDYFWVNDNVALNPAWVIPGADGYASNAVPFIVLSVTDNTHLALTTNYNSIFFQAPNYQITGGAGKLIASTTTALKPGAFPWYDNSALWPGYAEQEWQTGLLMGGLQNYDIIKGGLNAVQTVMLNWVANLSGNFIVAACANSSGATLGNFIPYAVYGGQFPPTLPGACDVSDIQGLSDSRSQNNIATSTLGYLYSKGLTSVSFGDTVFGANFGYDVGINADGYRGLMATTGNAGKQYGQSFRDSLHYPAIRTGTGTSPVPFTLSIAVNLADVPNATNYSILLTKPSGEQSTTACASSPCAVIADSLQGNHTFKVAFKSVGGATLAVADPVTIAYTQ